MRKPIVALFCAASLSPAAAAIAQTRAPEIRNYTFVTEIGGAAGLWVNPGAAGFNPTTRINGFLTFDRPKGEGWSVGQYSVGLQPKVLGFGYRHDEFSDPAGHPQGDAYTVALGLARGSDGFGVARTWRTVSDADGSWDIGYVHHQDPGVSVGMVWRDIGSPVVRGIVRRETLVGAVTLVPNVGRFSLSLQADYRTDGGDFAAFRIGGTFSPIGSLDALALAQWNGDGDFDGLRIGVVIRGQKSTVLGGAGLNAGGDARTASIGADLEFRPQE